MRNPNYHTRLNIDAAAGIGVLAMNVSACGTKAEPAPKEETCAFTVFSQIRFKVNAAGGYGAAVRVEPDIQAEKIGSYAGNDTIKAIGYVVTSEAAYTTNPEAINGDHWIVTKTLDGQTGYVSDAGIRADKTKNDPTGLSDNLGPLVDFNALPASCNVTN